MLMFVWLVYRSDEKEPFLAAGTEGKAQQAIQELPIELWENDPNFKAWWQRYQVMI